MAGLPTFESQNELLIQEFANGAYNVQVGSETMAAVMADIETAGSADAAFNSYYAFSYGSAAAADVAAVITANVNIIEGENDVTAEMVTLTEAYIASVITANPGNEGAALSALMTAYSAVTTGPYAAAAASWNAEIATALEWEGEADVAVGTENPVQDFFMLTANQDIVDGSAGDDMFVADVVQVNGPQVNSLGTGDAIDGDAGYDTLSAIVTEGVFLGGGNMPIQPWLESVEAVELQAVNSNIGLEVDSLNLTQVLDLVNIHAGDIIPEGNISLETDVYFNAKNVTGLDIISSDHSDANLTIQDLTTLTDAGVARDTEEITVGMKYTTNADSRWAESDLHVYFDQDYLLAGQSLEGQESIVYEIMNKDAYDTVGPNSPLLGVTFAKLEFFVQGDLYDLSDVMEIDDAAGDDIVTYQDFVDQGNAALVEKGLDNDEIYFDLGPAFVETDGRTGLQVILYAPAGDDLRTSTPNPDDSVFIIPAITEDVEASNRLDRALENPDPVPSDDLIAVGVEFEKAGRGGDGGELVIGGMNKDGDNEWGDGSDSTPAGVEQFNVVVNGGADLPNSVSSLRSTNNALQEVYVESEEGGTASLTIGNSNTAHLADIYTATFQNALKDVRVFNAAQFDGDLTLFAGITDESIAKSLDLVDEDFDTDADNVNFAYIGGTGDDEINLQVDSDVIAHEDAEVTVSTGEGDDMVTFAIMNGPRENGGLADTHVIPSGPDDMQWYLDQVQNDAINIDTGIGNDVVWTPGSGNVNIMTGAGDDVVYADNTGMGRTSNQFSAFLYNTRDMLPGDNWLNEAGTDTIESYSIAFGTVTVSFMGHEVTVELNPAVGNVVNDNVTDLQINNAIKEAVNGNHEGGDEPGLSAVLTAYDAEGAALAIESLIDGAVPAPIITVSAPTSLTSTQLNQVNAAWGTNLDQAGALAIMNTAATNFSDRMDYVARVANTGPGGFTPIVGATSIHTSDNQIEGGTGDDVFVLGTGTNSNDTLVYSGYENDFDCVYNFDQTWIPAGDLPVNSVNTPETFTLDFADFTGNSDDFIIATAAASVVDLNGLENAQGVIPAADVAFATSETPVLGYDVVGYTAGDTSVTFEAVIPGDQADVVVTIGDAADAAATTLTIVDGTVAYVAPTSETFDIDFARGAGSSDDLIADVDGSLLMDGATIDYVAGDGPLTLAAKMAAATYDNYTAVDNGDGTVSFTAIVPGAVTPGDPTAFLTQIDADNPTLLADFGNGGIQTPALIDTYFGVFASWSDGTDGQGSQTLVPFPAMAGPGLDMIDYTAYDVDAVYVNGNLVEGALTGAGSDYVSLVSNPNNPGEYTVTERDSGANGTYDGALDTELGLIGVIDFGADQGVFTDDTFIIV